MRILITTLIIVIGLTMYGIFGDPFNTQFDQVQQAQYFEASAKKQPRKKPDSLKVMTWNIKFGGDRIKFFFECGGKRVHMSRDEVAKNLSGIATKIKQVDPDIVFLQEIDIESKRVAYVNQVQRLLENTKLNYGVYASQWKASYIPKKWIGYMESGHAILSKWPMTKATRRALPLIDGQDPITRYFYLKRSILTAKLKYPQAKNPTLVGTHLTAFAEDNTKQQQLIQLKKHLGRLDRQGESFIAAGDLNTVPPGSRRRKNFPDTKHCPEDQKIASDYSDEVGHLDGFYRDFEPAIKLDDYRKNNDPYFTYTGDKNGFWNRKLDYIFTNETLNKGLVHQDKKQGGMKTMPLSDHAPVTAIYPVDRE